MMDRRKLAVVTMISGLVFATALWAQKPKRVVRGKETTVRGRLTDIHSYMTGAVSGENAIRATQDSFRAGAAAGIETEGGLVILGSGDKGPARMIVPLAQQEVVAKGKLFEKNGLRYLDLTGIQAHKEQAESTPAEDEHEVIDEHVQEEHAAEETTLDEPVIDEGDAEEESDEEP